MLGFAAAAAAATAAHWLIPSHQETAVSFPFGSIARHTIKPLTGQQTGYAGQWRRVFIWTWSIRSDRLTCALSTKITVPRIWVDLSGRWEGGVRE